MSLTLCTFNANNLFVRYKFQRKYPGASKVGLMPTEEAEGWGYQPPADWKNYFRIHDPEQRDLTAQALFERQQAYPDVVCLQEVESLAALRLFNENHLEGHYDHLLLIDSHDPRLIDVGLLSTRPLQDLRTHVDDKDSAGKYVFSRDCLEVEVAVDAAPGGVLTLFLNHFKSKFLTPPPRPAGMSAADYKLLKDEKMGAARVADEARRQQQADRVRSLLRARFPGKHFQRAWFIVMGDLNDAPRSACLRRLLQEIGLENVVERLPLEEQWTHYWKDERSVSQMDYLLLSPALSRATQGQRPYIERQGIGLTGRSAVDGRPLPQKVKLVQDDTYHPAVPYTDFEPPTAAEVPFQFARFSAVTPDQAASDHCPVFLEIL
jgi:endonuclease/exonuclease/phosphatase family metal-dependent hydrolase